MKKLKALMRDRAPSLDKIKMALGFEKLGSERKTDERSIETNPFDDWMVRRRLRHQEKMGRRRNR